MNKFKKGIAKANADEDFDIRKVISRLLDHWKLYVLSVAFCVFAAFLFIRYSTPMFKVHGKVLVQDDQKNSSPFSFMGGGAMQDFSSLFGIKSNVYNELGILQTRNLFDKVVKQMNLDVAYYRKGRVRSVELYNKSPFTVQFLPSEDSIQTTLFDISFPATGRDNRFVMNNDKIKEPGKTYSFGDTVHTQIGKIIVSRSGQPFENMPYFFTLNNTDEVVAGIMQNLTADIENRETTIINLAYNTSIPQKGQDVLYSLINAYIERNLSEKNKISDSTISFIDGRISIVSKELNDLEAGIQGFKQKNNIADITEQSKVLISNSSDYYNKMNETEVQLNVVNSMLQTIKEDNKRPVPSLLNSDPGFLSLVEKYNSLVVQRDKLLLSTTENNPIVKNIDGQLTSLRGDMVKSLQNQQKALQIAHTKIASENVHINTMVSNVPVQERKFVDLSRERDVKQALYLFLLQQKEQTAITKSSNIPSAAIIETPKSEYRPYFPSSMMVYAVGLLVGLLIPSVYVGLKYTLTNRIVSKEDITDNTDCNVLAEIGHSKTEALLAEDAGRSILAEQFRLFRTNMDFITPQGKTPKILITSTMTGEGKSFIAANLAQVYAFSGKKVLLMEMDLRKPRLSSMLGMPNAKGFSNYIISDKPVFSFIEQLPQSPNVYLLSSGPIPPNPAELMMLPKMNAMFETLSDAFDVLIVDSPPIGAVADAQILSRFADVNLYIIRQGYSYKNSLEIINDIKEHQKFSNLYLVVNDVRKGTSYGYRYGYGYGYGYGYAYGSNGQENGKLKNNGNGNTKVQTSVKSKMTFLKKYLNL